MAVNWEGSSIPHNEQLSVSNCSSFLTPSLPGFVHAICQSNFEQVMYLHYFSCSSLSLRNIIIKLHMVVGHTLYYNPGWGGEMVCFISALSKKIKK